MSTQPSNISPHIDVLLRKIEENVVWVMRFDTESIIITPWRCLLIRNFRHSFFIVGKCHFAQHDIIATNEATVIWIDFMFATNILLRSKAKCVCVVVKLFTWLGVFSYATETCFAWIYPITAWSSAGLEYYYINCFYDSTSDCIPSVYNTQKHIYLTMTFGFVYIRNSILKFLFNKLWFDFANNNNNQMDQHSMMKQSVDVRVAAITADVGGFGYYNLINIYITLSMAFELSICVFLKCRAVASFVMFGKYDGIAA